MYVFVYERPERTKQKSKKNKIYEKWLHKPSPTTITATPNENEIESLR